MTTITPATDAQIAEWEQRYPNENESPWARRLIARIRELEAERERVIDLVIAWEKYVVENDNEIVDGFLRAAAELKVLLEGK